MKRLLAAMFIGAMVLGTPLSVSAQSPQGALTFDMVPQVGMAYAGSFDPGLSGVGLKLGGALALGKLLLEAGAEGGTAPIGWQILFPLSAGVRLGGTMVMLDLLAEASPGIALSQPVLFVGALGCTARAVWNVARAFAVTAAISARYTVCPAYAAFTGLTYADFGLPISLGMRWTLR